MGRCLMPGRNTGIMSTGMKAFENTGVDMDFYTMRERECSMRFSRGILSTSA